MEKTAFAVGAAVVALAMGTATLERYLRTRKPHELAWTVALACFALASFALGFGARHGWNHFIFKSFFLFGAIINVPVLALGSIYLIMGKRGHKYAIAIAILCAYGAGVISSASFIRPLPINQLAQGSKVFNLLPRLLAGLYSGLGAFLIIGIAIWSAFRRPNKRFVIANLLIALGTLITGASGLLNSVLGAMNAFSITLALGITVIFAGFLTATAQVS